jgi:ribonucleoside-diphosphate reductase alpha chain/ribonucleoside-triphosphate reductase
MNNSVIPAKQSILNQEFLGKYPEFPKEMNALGKFVYYRTYSRWLPDKKRRETWKETCARATEYNMSLAPENFRSVKEAEEYFDNMFHLRQFLSGRTLWVGGTPVAAKYPMSNFNCAFTIIEKWEDFRDLFYLLMVGTGVGFRILERDVSKLKPVRQGIKLVNHDYYPVRSKDRLERTEVDVTTDANQLASNVAVITIGDSKEGKLI